MSAPSRRRALKSLPDLAAIEIDLSKPAEERIAGFLEATGGDPYRLRSGNVEVELAFAGEASVEEIVAHYLGEFGPPA